MSARKIRGTKKTGLPQEWRDKIQATQLINRLFDSAMGSIDMTSQQIRSAEILLKKILPDLAAVDSRLVDGEGNDRDLMFTINKIVHDARDNDKDS